MSDAEAPPTKKAKLDSAAADSEPAAAAAAEDAGKVVETDAMQDSDAGKDASGEVKQGEAAAEAAASAGADTAAADGAGDAAACGDEAKDDEDNNNGNPSTKAQQKEVKLGFKVFDNPEECRRYYHNIAAKGRVMRNLNEYEFVTVLDLLKKGHPEPERKVGQGVQAIQVRDFTGANGFKTKCFFVVREDGSAEDFSYVKCIAALWPGYSSPGKNRRGDVGGRRGRGGRGGGRGGRRGRGRGSR